MNNKHDSLVHRFLEKTTFESYEDFVENFRIICPDNFNFAFDVLDVYAQQEPDRLALVWCDDKGHELFLTFGELKKRVDKTANLLRNIGIKKGDRVLLTLKGRHEFWYCVLALHKLGAVAIPATHMLKVSDLAYRIQSAEIVAAISVNSDTLLEDIEQAQRETGNLLKYLVSVNHQRDGWLNYDLEVAKQDESFQRPPRGQGTSNDDPMLIYFTSGTSGFPKMVQHNYDYPLGHIITACYWQNVQPRKLHYTVADTGWAKAVWGKLYGQWFGGAVIFVHDADRFSAASLMTKIQHYKIATFCAPPTVYRYLIKEDLTKYDLSELKYCVVAGEPLNPEVFHQFYEKTGIKLKEGFGQTELVVTTANWPWMEPKPGSMGKPSPGYNLRIVDSDGNDVEIGEVGEIVLDTAKSLPPGIFAGYYKNPTLTKTVWDKGIYHTGDEAWMDEDGFIWYVGRRDDVIKSAGYRIGPFEVESVLMEHPAVLECAVTGIPDIARGQVVKATIVLAKNYTPSQALIKELQNQVKQNTAPYKYPRVIEFVEHLPKTISGKIRRVEIRDEQQKS